MQAKTKTAWTFAITSIALFMVVLDNLVVSTALPVIRTDLGATIEQLNESERDGDLLDPLGDLAALHDAVNAAALRGMRRLVTLGKDADRASVSVVPLEGAEGGAVDEQIAGQHEKSQRRNRQDAGRSAQPRPNSLS